MRFAAVIFLLGASVVASSASAQGPRDALAPPGDSIRPTPAAPTAEREELLIEEVPAPPGAGGAVPDVRYPLPGALLDEDEEPAIRIPSRITTRLRALDADLRALSQRGGGNVVNAVLSMLTGGLAITLGALKDNPTDWMSIYLYVYGGASAVRGVLDLVLSPNPSGAAITYQHMPMTTQLEVRERLAYGEAQLESLAEQALIARILDASINMAAGVAVVPIYLAPNNFEIGNPLDYFILIGAGVSLVSGIITLATSSAEEQRWEAYERLRTRLDQEHRDETSEGDEPTAEGPVSTWRVGASPSPSGGFASFDLTF
ncbi:MAG: hypothetical protein H6719_03445 [Sandaracinaceae bacterium]|nr:hypothetical protein [Sandaracinaceae bacterium]